MKIDLLSQGGPTIVLPELKLQELPAYRYKISVCYGSEHIKFDLYPVPLSQRLPRGRIPLKDLDSAVVLDLPAVFSRAYDNGGYADVVDYSQPPLVPLSKEETVHWNTGSLAKKDPQCNFKIVQIPGRLTYLTGISQASPSK